MKFSTKIILGVLAFAALCLVYYSDDYFSRKKEEKKEELSKAMYFKPADAVKLTLKNSNGNFVFTRENNTSDWKMLEPQQVGADQDVISNTLAALSQINIQQELTESVSKENTTQFGLEKPKIVASVTLEDKKERTLKIGNGVDIGNKNGDTPISVYGLNPDNTKVLVLDAGSMKSLENKTFNNLRTKRVATFKLNDVASISISSKQTNISTEKKQDKWGVTAPQTAVADERFITSFIQTFQSLYVQSVVEKNESLKRGLQKYGLATPAAKIQFKDAQNKLLQEFNLGITKEAVYVQMPDGAVGKLNLASWPDYVPKAVKFQNRQVLLGLETAKITTIQLNPSLYYVKKDSSWYKLTSLAATINEKDKPNSDALSFFSNFEFMAASDLIANPTQSDLDKFGLTKPVKKFSFIFGKEMKPQSVEISIGNRPALDKKSVYLKRSDSSTVYVVNGDWLEQLDKLSK